MTDKKYDLVISLGAGCPVAGALKDTKITEKSYPFDWSGCDGDASEKFIRKCILIKNHFKDAFDVEDFIEYSGNSDPDARCVKNVKTGLHYWHDFPWEKPVKDFFPEFLEKYQRRVKRLYDDVEKSKDILFVYQDDTGVLPINTIKTAIGILKESFPKKHICLLICLSKAMPESLLYKEIKLNLKDVYFVTCLKTDPAHFLPGYRVYSVSKALEKFFKKEYFSFIYDKEIISLGLSDIEPFGRWSKDETVFFRLNTASKAKKVVVEMTVCPFVHEKRPTQKAKIICNGHDITEIVFDTPGKQKINLVVPNDNNGDLDFIFEFDNPQSPKELGLSSDDRKLALGFVDAIITEKQG